MLKRGRRDVGAPGLSSVPRSRGRKVGGADGSLLLLVLLVSDELDVVDGPGGPLISVVDNGAVLVMVAVVVVAGVAEAVAVKDGSTKSSGAFGASWPVV